MASKTRTALTVADLDATLEHPDHLGWGYATSRSIESDDRRERLDRNVVHVANELGLTTDELFMWSNSKNGRWLADEAGTSVSRATVRHYLNAESIIALKVETGDLRSIPTADLERLQRSLANDHRLAGVFAKVALRERLWLVNSELATR